MKINRKTLSQLGLPSASHNITDQFNGDILSEKNYDVDRIRNFVETNKPLLVNDQLIAYNTIKDATTTNDNGSIFFLDVPGATVKTFL